MSNPFKAGSLSVTPTSIAARDAIANPVDGQIIYLTHDDLAMSVPLATPRYEYYHAETVQWYELGSGPADPAIFVALKDGSGAYVAPEGLGGLENTSQQGADLDGLPVTDVLSRMLYPTLYPTAGTVSASLSLNGSLLVEYGESVSKLMTAGFNRGAWTSDYTMLDDQGQVADTNVAGLPNEYRFLFKGVLQDTQATTATSNVTFTTTAGDATAAFAYTVEVDFDEGSQGYDSTGAPFGSALVAGTRSSTQTVDISYYNFNNTPADAPLNLASTGADRQTLLALGDGYELNYIWTEDPNQGAVNRHAFAFADPYGTISKIQQWNPVGSAWEDIVIGDIFAITTTTRNAPNGTAITYNVYTATGSQAGPRKFKVFF